MTKPTCGVPECDRKVVAYGYCDPHYRRWRKTGDPGPLMEARPNLLQRFQAKYKKSPSECWLWTARTLPHGYGVLYVEGKWKYAHRVAHELFNGPIPDDYQVDHLCRVRHCVNPAHLEAVTPRENNARSESVSAKQARRTHCIRGHEFSDENTYRNNGKRGCKTCRRNRKRKGVMQHATS